MNEILIEAERSLVGAALVDPTLVTECRVAPEHFADLLCRSLWQAITDGLATSSEIDPLTIAASMPPSVRLYDVQELIINAGNPRLAPHWAVIVHNHWVHRQLAMLPTGLSDLEAPDALLLAKHRLEAVEASSGGGLPRLEDMLAVDYTDPGGLPTGIGVERVAPGGIPRGRVTLIQGETGNFKSTVANNIAWAMAEQGHVVLAVPLEDSNHFNRDKFLSRYSGVPFGSIGNPSCLSAAERSAVEAVASLPVAARAAKNIIMGGDVPPNVDEIIRTARYHKRQDGVEAVLVDYIQLIEAPGSQYEQFTHIMKRLQNSAAHDGLAYIVVSQVKQDVDQRDDHRPKITDALGGSAMRMASKLLIGVHRPSKYEPVPKKTSPYFNVYANHPNGKDIYSGLLEMHILKNASGEADTILHAHVDPPTGVIRPLTKTEVL